jgi:hypothetical protein
MQYFVLCKTLLFSVLDTTAAHKDVRMILVFVFVVVRMGADKQTGTAVPVTGKRSNEIPRLGKRGETARAKAENHMTA